jgi:hypothetical protein
MPTGYVISDLLKTRKIILHIYVGTTKPIKSQVTGLEMVKKIQK